MLVPSHHVQERNVFRDSFDFNIQPTFADPIKLKKSTLSSDTNFVAKSKLSGITK